MPPDRARIEYASPAASPQRATNAGARIGCVLAVGFLLPPIALVGALASWVGLRRSVQPQVRGRRAALIGLWFGLIGIGLTPVELLTLRWAMAKADEVKCCSQLYALVFCVQVYANGNDGQLPPDLPTAVIEQGLPLNDPVLFCPASGVTSAPSYVYLHPVPRMEDIKVPAATVMFYEPPAHFGGMHVAFYDGHVELVPHIKAAKVLAELRAGQNPPPTLAAP